MNNHTIEKLFVSVIIYLIGCVFGYVIFRHSYKSNKDIGVTWTEGYRAFGIFVSLFSWIAVGIAVLIIFIEEISKSDKPAKW